LYSTLAWQQLIDAVPRIEDLAKQTENKSHYLKLLQDQNNWLSVAGGITNFNYKLTLGELCFFVQVLDSEKLKRLPTQQFVPTNLVMEKKTSLKHWLVPCLYETENLRVFSWVDADNTSSEIFSSEKLEHDLLQFLSVLHSSISILPILDIKQHLEHYYQLAIINNPAKKKALEAILKRGIECAQNFVPSKNCHNDLSPGNILYSKQDGEYKMYVVDWEYACISDPFFDLAGICINFGFSEAQENNLIQNYSEKLSIYPSLDKFNKMKELYQIINSLWSTEYNK
jgi:thiamine kinase-like enzyme